MTGARRAFRLHALALPAALVLLAALAPGASGQTPGVPVLEPSGSGWRPSIGLRAGLDYRNSAPAIGALLHLPIPGLPASLVPGGDLVFHDGLTERQATLDLTVDVLGLHVGGGPVLLNSIFEADGPRETQVGYALLAGFRSRLSRFGTRLEFRWQRVEDLDSRFITLGVTYTPGAPRRR